MNIHQSSFQPLNTKVEQFLLSPLYILSPTATPVNFHDVFAHLGGSIS